MLVTFIIYFTYSIPNGTDSFDVGIFTISSHGFTSARLFVYHASTRIATALLALLAFLHINKYYAHGFIVAFAHQVFRTWGAFDPSIAKVDEWEWILVIPVALIVLIILYRIRYLIQHRSVYKSNVINMLAEDIDSIEKNLHQKRNHKK